jgi:peptidoglycan/LPS O-acetylase OafA/YrhL
MAELKIELPAPVSGRLPLLDELKGLAIILVILYHAGGVLVWNNYLHGDIGVDMFVILSGLGLALGSRYTSAREFLTRRLGRILPTYWIVLTVLLVLNSHFLQKQYSWTDIGLHYLGVHAWFGDAYGVSINDSFWFITLILTLYLLYCAVQPWMGRADHILLFGGIVSCAGALGLFFWNQPSVFSHLGLRLPGFFLGILAGKTMKNAKLAIPLTWQSATALFLFTYLPYTQGVIFHSTVVAAAVMAFYGLALRPRLPAAMGDRMGAALRFLGRHSLEIFLIHQPLMREYNFYLHGRWLNVIRPSPFSLMVGMVIALAVTLLLSVELRRLLQKLPFPAKA